MLITCGLPDGGPGHSVVVAEGLDVFRVPMPDWLAGRSLADSRLSTETGCNVLGLVRAGSDRVEPPPAATEPLPRDAARVLIGDARAQERFSARDGE